MKGEYFSFNNLLKSGMFFIKRHVSKIRLCVCICSLDSGRMVWAHCDPLLCQAELRPCSGTKHSCARACTGNVLHESANR